MLDAGVTREVQHKLAVFLEQLLAQDLGEQVSGVGFARDVVQGHAPSPTQLTHLKHLSIDVA